MSMPAPASGDPFASVLGASDAADHMRAFGRRAAAVAAPVLLTGETGTGKGVLARAIHAASSRWRAAFVAVNCAGVPESLFESEFFGHTRGAFTGAHYARRGVLEQADRGTLFLDEIGELPPALQAKLLTVLEDGEVRRLGGERVVRVDVRLIAATAQDLERAVGDGRFRLDLYHRLLVLGFTIPPLRARGDDALLLARHFLDRHRRRYARAPLSFARAAEHRILTYAWPGNVRQLSNAVEAAVLATDGTVIQAGKLPLVGTPVPAPPPAAGGPPSAAASAAATGQRRRYSFFGTREEERATIIAALRRCHGNKTLAAEALGMTRNTLRSRLRSLGIAVVEAGPGADVAPARGPAGSDADRDVRATPSTARRPPAVDGVAQARPPA
jgi:DNA-binding NtrC family response regulator